MDKKQRDFLKSQTDEVIEKLKKISGEIEVGELNSFP